MTTPVGGLKLVSNRGEEGVEIHIHAHIRRAAESDIPAILALQQQWSDEAITYGYQPSTEEQLRAALGPHFFVAEAQGQVVGPVIGYITGSVGISPGLTILPEGHAYLAIDDLYVLPEWRSQGVGHSLLDASIASAEQAGVQAAMLFTATKDVHRILRFYEQNGFQSWGVQLFKRW